MQQAPVNRVKMEKIMAQKKKTKAMVVSQEKLADGIYDLRLETELAQDAACGQFVGVYPKDKSTLLPRPISICEIDKEKNQLRLVYRVAGKGPAECVSAWRFGKWFPGGQGKAGHEGDAVWRRNRRSSDFTAV